MIELTLLIISAGIALVGLVMLVDHFTPPTSCTYDCEQGRRCTCRKKP